jgi:hypothetical protein
MQLNLKVLRSKAGYYVGTWCECGPVSRETGYYKTMEEASKDSLLVVFDEPSCKLCGEWLPSEAAECPDCN